MPPSRITESGRYTEPTLMARSGGIVGKDGGGSFAYSGPGLAYGLGIFPGSTGTPVTPVTAMGSATVYACVKRLSEDVGKLPVRIRRRTARGGWKLDLEHPLNKVFRAPNGLQTSSQCWAYYVSSLALRGNGYLATVRNRDGAPTSIIPINPDRVYVKLGKAGELYYNVGHPLIGDVTVKLDQDNVAHAKGFSYDGFMGISPIALAQDAFGLALAAQSHGAVLFRQGAQLKGFITHPGTLGKEAKEYLTESFEKRYAGVQNAHRTAVLEEGMKFESVTMTNEDAQFLESRQFSVVEICRMFGVPPHKVQDLENGHLQNVEQGEQQYINDTLDPLCNQIGELLETKLLFEDEQGEYQIRHDFSALLRGDRKTRGAYYHFGIGDGWMTRNEARLDDGREADDPALDEYLSPLNMATTEQQQALTDLALADPPADDARSRQDGKSI
jgi:HK97 family phage portal protein